MHAANGSVLNDANSDRLRRLKFEINAALMPEQEYVSAQMVNHFYRVEFGNVDIPYWKFGCDSLDAFLQSIDDTVISLKIGKDIRYKSRPTAANRHVAEMVAKQRAKVTNAARTRSNATRYGGNYQSSTGRGTSTSATNGRAHIVSSSTIDATRRMTVESSTISIEEVYIVWKTYLIVLQAKMRILLVMGDVDKKVVRYSELQDAYKLRYNRILDQVELGRLFKLNGTAKAIIERFFGNEIEVWNSGGVLTLKLRAATQSIAPQPASSQPAASLVPSSSSSSSSAALEYALVKRLHTMAAADSTCGISIDTAAKMLDVNHATALRKLTAVYTDSFRVVFVDGVCRLLAVESTLFGSEQASSQIMSNNESVSTVECLSSVAATTTTTLDRCLLPTCGVVESESAPIISLPRKSSILCDDKMSSVNALPSLSLLRAPVAKIRFSSSPVHMQMSLRALAPSSSLSSPVLAATQKHPASSFQQLMAAARALRMQNADKATAVNQKDANNNVV